MSGRLRELIMKSGFAQAPAEGHARRQEGKA